MRLTAEALSQQLKKTLLPIYLLYGNEPFLITESAHLIRHAFSALEGEQSSFSLENPSKDIWNDILHHVQTGSLFSDKKLIELRFGSKVSLKDLTPLASLLEMANEHTIFLLVLPSLSQAQQKAPWFITAENAGAVIAHWSLTPYAFNKWVESRVKQKGITLPENSLGLLISHTEGNCLGAAQEIDRLALLYMDGDINEVSPFSALSQYTVFDLCHAALQCTKAKVLPILDGLRKSGTAAPLIIWALSQTLRTLIQLEQISNEKARQSVFFKAGILSSKHALYLNRLTQNPPPSRALLAHLFSLDKMVKLGQEAQIWPELADICLQLARASNSVKK